MSVAARSANGMPAAAKAFIGGLTGLGLLIFATVALRWEPEQPGRFLLFFLASLVASTLKVGLPGVRGSMSVNFLFILIGILRFSFSETIVMGCAAGAVQLVWKSAARPDPVKLLFNVSAMAGATTVAWYFFHAEWMLALGAGDLVRLGCAAIAFFVMNTVPVAAIVAIVEKRSAVRIWWEYYFWSLPYYLIGAAFAGLLSVTNRYFEWQTTLLMLPIVYFFYRSYRNYLGRLESEKQHALELTARTEALKKEVAERRRAEQVVRESEERYRALFESSPHPMWVYDRETLEFTEVNEAATNHYGFSRSEFLSMKIGEIVATEQEDGGNPRAAGSLVHRKKDGTRIDVEVRAHDVNFGGRACRLVLADDVTERKLAEELRIQKDAAVEANRAKSEFLANMSHELRTPLNAIIGYSELLIEDGEDLGGENGERAYLEDVGRIHGAGKHLLGLINDILDLSKIEAGKMQLHREDFEVRNMIDGVCATLQPLIRANRNTLDVSCAEDVGIVNADLTKTRQILFNLLSNAAKFTHDGRITLEARRERDSEGERIAFQVSDTGIGMSLDQIRRVGRPFTQADASTTRKYGGTGLGLVISQQFCEMMGGEITVESEPGAGSTFTAWIRSGALADGKPGDAGRADAPAS